MALREQRLELGIFDEAVGLVVALALLVLDDADLVGELLLGRPRRADGPSGRSRGTGRARAPGVGTVWK